MFFANPRVRPGSIRRQLKKGSLRKEAEKCRLPWGGTGKVHCYNVETGGVTRPECSCVPRRNNPDLALMAEQWFGPGATGAPARRQLKGFRGRGTTLNPGFAVGQQSFANMGPRHFNPEPTLTFTLDNTVLPAAAQGVRVPGMARSQRRALRAARRGGRAPGVGRLAAAPGEARNKTTCELWGGTWASGGCVKWAVIPTLEGSGLVCVKYGGGRCLR